MKVFVAGATGAIGRQLVPMLVSAGHEVFGTSRDIDKQAALRTLGAVPVIMDALDPDQVRRRIGEVRPDVLVHQLTAISSIDTRDMRRSFAATNRLRTTGTDNLLSAAREHGVGRVVAQSHISVYRRVGGSLKTETDPVGNVSPSSLHANEQALLHLEGAVLGDPAFEGVALRYGWFYGPGTSMTRDAETLQLIATRKFPVLGDGGAVWSFVHVADAAEATLAAIQSGAKGVFNVVDDEPARVGEWLPEVARQLGARAPFRVPRLLARLLAGEAGLTFMTELRGASNAKAKHDLGWTPRHATWRRDLVN